MMTFKLPVQLAAISAAFLVGSVAFAADTITAVTTGMTCEECAESVETRLMENEAVADVEIDLSNGTITVTLKEGADLDEEVIENAVNWGGYEVTTFTRSEA